MERPLEINNVENLTLQGLNGALLQLDTLCHCQRQQCIQLPFHYLEEIVLSDVCCSIVRLTNVSTVRDLFIKVSSNLLSGVIVENCVKIVINHLYYARDGIVGLHSKQIRAENLEVHNTSVGVSFMNTSESLIYNAQMNSESIGLGVSESNNIIISGVTSTGNNYAGLYFRRIMHVICKDIYLPSNKFGVFIKQCYNVSLHTVSGSDNEFGVTLLLCHNTKVQDIEMVRSLQSSIEASSCNSLTITNFLSSQSRDGAHFYECIYLVLDAVFIEETGIGIRHTNCHHSKLSNMILVGNRFGMITENGVSLRIENCSIEKNKRYGILISEFERVTLQNVTVKESGWLGILVQAAYVSMRCVILKGNGFQGLHLENCNDVTLEDVSAVQNELSGVQMFHCHNVHVTGLTLSYTGLFIFDCSKVSLRHSQIDSIKQNGLSFYQSLDVTIVESNFSLVNYLSQQSSSSALDTPAIVVSYNSSLKLRDCNFIRNNLSSIVASGSTSIVVEGIVSFVMNSENQEQHFSSLERAF